MTSAQSQIYFEFDKLNNAQFDNRNHTYTVEPNRLYTSDMDGVLAVLKDGRLVIDGDVYAEDQQNYVKAHFSKN